MANRTPGINAIAQLEEGKKFGETDVIVTASNTKTISGSSLADNTGSRSSGTGKITNTINMDGLFNFGRKGVCIPLNNQRLCHVSLWALKYNDDSCQNANQMLL